MFNFLIKDGNFKEWVRIFCVIVGISFVALGIMISIKSMLGGFFFLIGFIIAATGGYAAQAHMLKLKPFDKAYKKAKDSYEQDKNNM
ncbi:MAG: hypothetical protein JWQ10_2022 [Herbaspirillum sp.]|nr:hypothetical protein [Herbaspirillum sp.]